MPVHHVQTMTENLEDAILRYRATAGLVHAHATPEALCGPVSLEGIERSRGAVFALIKAAKRLQVDLDGLYHAYTLDLENKVSKTP